MNKLCYALILFISPLLLTAQSNYYVKGTTTTGGIELIDGGANLNATICQVKNGDKIEEYTPYQISEYGFSDGRIYKSFEVIVNDSLKRYFLENTVSGKLNLYYLKRENRYLLMQKDSNNLMEIPRSKPEFRLLFTKILYDRPQAKEEIPLITFKYYPLKRVITNYNKNSQYLFPRFRYGVFIGWTASQYSVIESKNIYSVPQLNKKWNFTFGAFMDIPIHSSAFSFHPELYIKRNNIAISYNIENNISYDLITNNTTVCSPLLFRYTILQKDNSPFFQLGTIVSKSIKNRDVLYEYTIDGNNVSINNIYHTPILQKNNIGFSIGMGIMSNVWNKISILSEIRYSKLLNLSKKSYYLNLSEITFNFGIVF